MPFAVVSTVTVASAPLSKSTVLEAQHAVCPVGLEREPYSQLDLP